jgi:AcrR family transcriptional regulator
MKTTESINEARERVLDVAEKLFMTKGFQAVSMRDIADALGVRQSSLYYHAPQGKEQLFYDAAVRGLERHKNELEAIIARYEPDFRRQLHEVGQWFVQLDDMDLVRLVRLDLPEISVQYKRLIGEAVHETLMRPICTIVERHQAIGHIRNIDPNALVGGLLAI